MSYGKALIPQWNWDGKLIRWCNRPWMLHLPWDLIKISKSILGLLSVQQLSLWEQEAGTSKEAPHVPLRLMYIVLWQWHHSLTPEVSKLAWHTSTQPHKDETKTCRHLRKTERRVCHRADVLKELLEHLNVTAVCWRMTSPAWHAQTAVRIQHVSPWGFVFPNKHYMSEVIHQQPLFYVPTHPFYLNTPLVPEWQTHVFHIF